MNNFLFGSTNTKQKVEYDVIVSDTDDKSTQDLVDYKTKVNNAFFINDFQYEDISDAEIAGLQVRTSDPKESCTCKVMYLDTGIYYAGDFVNGCYHGLGKLVYPNKIIKSGFFKDGAFVKGNILLPDGHYEYFNFENEQHRVCFQDGCNLIGNFNTSSERHTNKSIVDGKFYFPNEIKTPEEKYELMNDWETPQLLYFLMATFPGFPTTFFNGVLKSKVKVSWLKKHYTDYEYMFDTGLLGKIFQAILIEELEENFGFGC